MTLTPISLDGGSDHGPRRSQAVRSGRWAPAGLVALTVIPALAGSSRLLELAGGPELIPTDARFRASPVPVAVHIVAALAFAVLGAFQFSAGLRRHRPAWHRRAGRLLVPLALTVAVTALWMTLVYPRKEGTGDLLYAFRLLAASGLWVSAVLGYAGVRRGDIASHRAWMTRAYALALGAGTQVFTVGIGQAVFGTGTTRTDVMQGAAWVVNLAVAERAIRANASPTSHRLHELTAT